MSEYIHKSHNVSILLYHYVCPAKYRRVVFNEKVEEILVNTCTEISKRYEINFIEIGTDGDQVHFLIQSVPSYAPSKIVTILKSITAREIFRLYPEVKKRLWGGNFWSEGYFVSTVGRNANEKQIENYVKNQGGKYEKIHQGQVTIFE
ncbi:MAG: IS200/IS605 family transposase [Clostridia bacterium]